MQHWKGLEEYFETQWGHHAHCMRGQTADGPSNCTKYAGAGCLKGMVMIAADCMQEVSVKYATMATHCALIVSHGDAISCI